MRLEVTSEVSGCSRCRTRSLTGMARDPGSSTRRRGVGVGCCVRQDLRTKSGGGVCCQCGGERENVTAPYAPTRRGNLCK